MLVRGQLVSNLVMAISPWRAVQEPILRVLSRHHRQINCRAASAPQPFPKDEAKLRLGFQRWHGPVYAPSAPSTPGSKLLPIESEFTAGNSPSTTLSDAICLSWWSYEPSSPSLFCTLLPAAHVPAASDENAKYECLDGSAHAVRACTW